MRFLHLGACKIVIECSLYVSFLDFTGLLAGLPGSAIRSSRFLLLTIDSNAQTLSIMANKDLNKAKSAKKDEFYTQLVDIENELKHYREHFRGKTVLCNCDDPRVSNFFHYFSYNFEQLGLKKLITTCYKNQERDLFSQHDSERAIWLEYTGDHNGNRIPDPEEIGINYLQGDGDFRSAECIELLKQADIVVTNPPFSLFREFLSLLIQYNKQFLIIGNINAVSYKETFQLFKEGKVWMGASIHSGDREFGVPDDYPLNAAGWRQDENGHKFIRVKGVRWFTNMDYKERHEDLILYKQFTREEYPRYDQYDIINVNKTSDIPKDYYGIMGVPITFLDKYNPDQFEILGIANSARWIGYECFTILNGDKLYNRILIRRRNRPATNGCRNR